MNSVLVLVLFCVVIGVWTLPPLRNADEINREAQISLEMEARAYVNEYNRKASERCTRGSIANWNHATNINDETEKIKLKISLDNAKEEVEDWRNLTARFATWRSFSDPDLFRMFKKITVLGAAALPEDKLEEYNKLKNEMTKMYSTTKVCSFHNKTRCNLSLEPDLTDILATSRNEEELRHIWTEWHDKCGSSKLKKNYERFVELNNLAAQKNDFADGGDYWLKDYESDTFKKDVEQLWQTLKPLYQKIHAYVRANLRNIYGAQLFEDGLIPAHLLGNMWAQSWVNVYSLMTPFPNKASIDVTDQMIQQGYNAKRMFELSDEFFTSLGLIPMPPAFWKESMIEKPKDREVVCHASAWDFCNGVDFRIKQCTAVTTEQLITVHHEMGHVQYYLLYKDQPLVYRRGANPGFHEAVGDTLALSVQTPKHLKEIKLLDENTPTDDYQTSINFLFAMALEKIAFLPFGYALDKYRWDIFDGSIDSSSYNAHWWNLRKEYQGLKPPTARSENHFDAGAKYHVPANVEYMRYFVSKVIQFQFHRSLCQAAGQYDANDPSKPLHNCDIYRSKEAGSRLKAGLSMGSSRPWPEAMQVMTGQDKMDASAIREYFKPLEDWLDIELHKLGENSGWD